jgi:hypothetical protein
MYLGHIGCRLHERSLHFTAQHLSESIPPRGSKYQWESCIFPTALHRYDSRGTISWWLDPCRKSQDCNSLIQCIRWMQNLPRSSSEWRNGSPWTGQVAANQIFLHGTIWEFHEQAGNKDRNVVNSFPGSLEMKRYIYPLIYSFGPQSTLHLLISFGICSMDCTPDGWDYEEIHAEKGWMFLAYTLLSPFTSKSYWKLLLKNCLS